MYRFLILDDNMKFGYYLKGRLERSSVWRKGAGQKIEAVVTLKKEQFQKAISETDSGYDAAFVDIEMPEDDGISIVKRLREEGSQLPVVFVSIHEQMVREAIYAKPLAFVRKEYLENDLEEAARALLKELGKQSKPVMIRQGRKRIQINPGEILYFESTEHYVAIHYMKACWDSSHPRMLRMKLSDMENFLKDRGFLRVHNRYLINLERAEFVEGCTKVRLGTLELPVSRGYKEDVSRKIMAYLGGEKL